MKVSPRRVGLESVMVRLLLRGLFVTLCLCLLTPPGHAEDLPEGSTPPLKVIPADDAFAHATETVIVELTVRNSNQIKDRNGRDVVFLNSRKDFRSEENFTVVIFSDAVARFRKQKIDDPARHFRGKKIRVTGGIELRRGKPQIILRKPEQIAIVQEQADPAEKQPPAA